MRNESDISLALVFGMWQCAEGANPLMRSLEHMERIIARPQKTEKLIARLPSDAALLRKKAITVRDERLRARTSRRVSEKQIEGLGLAQT